jgi:alpha-beta hydrolase superfamily lysophospholipase
MMSGVTEELDRCRGAGGRELLLHRVLPAQPPRAAALLLHGIQSHAGWYLDTARYLAAAGVEVALPERRGSGLDRRDRGDAASPWALLEDARRAGRHLRATSGHLPVWVGISWGAKLAYLVAREHPGEVAGLALVVPGLCSRVDLQPWEQLRVLAALGVGGRVQLPIPLQDPALFSREPRWQAYVASDPLALHTATARFLLGSRLLDLQLRRRRVVPRGVAVLLVLSGDDRIVDPAATLRFLRAGVGGSLQVLELEETRHTPEFGPEARHYQEALLGFILAPGGEGLAALAGASRIAAVHSGTPCTGPDSVSRTTR